MARQKLFLHYAIIQILYWMTFTTMSGFASVYLLDQGFTNTMIGVLLALTGLFSTLIMFPLSVYADRRDSIPLNRLIGILLGFFLAGAGLTLFSHHRSITGTAVSYSICVTMLYAMTPFVNTLGIRRTKLDPSFNFGFARGLGSLFYALFTFALGWLLPHTGTVLLPVMMLMLFSLLLLIVLFFPSDQAEKTTAETNSSGMFTFFRTYPGFTLILIGMIGVYMGHSLINNYVFQIIQFKGGAEGEMGTVVSIACLFELPVMFGYAKLQKRFSSSFMLGLSAVFFTIKILLSLLAPNFPVYCAVQCTQMLAFGLMAVNSVYYTADIMTPGDAVKGQTYFATTQTVGALIGSLAGGRIIDVFGINAMMLFGTVTTAGCTAIILFSLCFVGKHRNGPQRTS